MSRCAQIAVTAVAGGMCRKAPAILAPCVGDLWISWQWMRRPPRRCCRWPRKMLRRQE